LYSKKEMETGKLIKGLRTKKGLTQEELADKTEVSARTIQRIENGEVDPRAYTLQMIAKALDVDYSLFIENESDESQKIQKANDNIWLGLLHLSGLLPLIFPTVLIWDLKKDKVKGITDHYQAVISFQLIVLGFILGGLWIYRQANQATPLIGVMLISSLLSIFNAIQVMSGKPYKHISFFKLGNKNDKTE
jgi:transcriptional regulator with XRE-family HTH domain